MANRSPTGSAAAGSDATSLRRATSAFDARSLERLAKLDATSMRLLSEFEPPEYRTDHLSDPNLKKKASEEFEGKRIEVAQTIVEFKKKVEEFREMHILPQEVKDDLVLLQLKIADCDAEYAKFFAKDGLSPAPQN